MQNAFSSRTKSGVIPQSLPTRSFSFPFFFLKINMNTHIHTHIYRIWVNKAAHIAPGSLLLLSGATMQITFNFLPASPTFLPEDLSISPPLHTPSPTPKTEHNLIWEAPPESLSWAGKWAGRDGASEASCEEYISTTFRENLKSSRHGLWAH